jgi:hypothetical protein
MISNAKIEGLLKPKSVETTQNGHYSLTYEEPVNSKIISDLVNENYFDINRYQDLLNKIIQLKIRLANYMLNSQNLNFSVYEVWYDSVTNDYQFIYLPGTKIDPLQELNFYRHIFIESPYIFDNDTKLLLELRHDSFDLNRFCALFQKMEKKKKSSGIWKFLLNPKEELHSTLETKTIQKSRKSCLLDADEPTRFHEIHFHHNIIGRSDECNIKIDDSSISRKHAVLYKKKLDFTLEDLDSSNGTFHNGQVIKGSVALVNGDKLQFGDKEFIFIL